MNSKQRAYLRSLANTIDAILQVGKAGINPNLIKQIDDALEARELIKISILETAPEEKNTIANEIAEKTNACLVQVIGNKVTLYRARKKEAKIVLPQ